MKGLFIASAVVSLFAGCAAESEPELDPAVELGFHRNGSYAALTEGGTCWVADAVQGGYWTMPAVRTQGMTDEAEVTCILSDDQVGELGRETTHRFFEAADGQDDTLELKQFLVPLAEVDDPMYASLPGRSGEIACSVRDDDGVDIDVTLGVVFDTEVAGPLEN
ncbi:MAG TPA: hypothetical protein VMZ28_06770 [Kofleriaceae bacterium]|nr:hypothetical protein [Kofleriaceae bacterium]